MENFEKVNDNHFFNRNLNKKITDIISKNKFSINNNNFDVQKELLFFKNEILKDMRNLEAKQTEKLLNFKEEQTKLTNLYEKKFLSQNEKINYLSNLIVDYFRKEKFEKYYEEFKKGIEKNFAEMTTKIYTLEGEIKDVLYKQENFFNENVLYPGVIGYQCKFKDLHDFVDYVLETIKKIELFQDILKSYELHKLQKNLETDLNTIQTTIKNNFHSLSKFTTDKVNESEQKMLQVLQDYNTQFVDVRIENNKNADNLMKRMNEVENNFERIIQIRKELNKKNEEQDKKLENIIQNVDDNLNKINEHNKEIRDVDTKFNLLTTYIDMQNEDNFDNKYNMYSRNYENNKFISSKRIKSARDFIARQMRLLSKGEPFINDDYNISFTKQGFNTGSNNKFNNSNNEIAKTQFRTINNNINPIRNFAKHKKFEIKGDSFIKRYITGKIGINDMYSHPKDLNKEKMDTPPTKNINYFSPKNDKSNLFNLTKLQSKQDKKEINYKKDKPKMLKINNNNFQNHKNFTKSLSDGNYNNQNKKLISHENFVKEINDILNKRHKNIQFNSIYNNQKTSYNKFSEQQLDKDKRFIPKKRKKLLIIQ